MPSLTLAAAHQVRAAAQQSNCEDLPLRVAATRGADGAIQYAVGFDDVGGDGDQRFTSHGVEIVVAPDSMEIVSEMTIDYVQLDSGEMALVFLNPKDPDYRPSQ
jgi:iron-sulfur cluster assembly protein